MNLLEFIKKPTSTSQFINMVKNVISENEPILTEIQKDQWSEGKDKFGKIIGIYKPYTEKVAREENPNKPKIAGQPYNLDWSGDLKRSTSVNTKALSNDVLIQIDSTSSSLLPLFQTIEKHGLLSNPNTIFGFEPRKKDVVTKLINSGTLKKLKQKYNV